MDESYFGKTKRMEKFDVIIIGAGPAGLFAAMELASQGVNVLILEKGSDLTKRICPAVEKRKACIKCPVCSITSGFGGAGAFSDGKITLSKRIGGYLSEYLEESIFEKYLKYVEEKFLEFGAPPRIFGTDTEKIEKIRYEAQKYHLELVPSRLLHMGTDKGLEVLSNIKESLMEKKVSIHFNEPALDLVIGKSHVMGVKTPKNEYRSKYVIMAPGRAGSEWTKYICKKLGIKTYTNPVDVGIRLEIPAEILRPLTDILYEPKIIYYSRNFDDRVRTFCVNPYGVVVPELVDDIISVNGHSYTYHHSENTNLAILVSTSFTEPFNDPVTYGKSIARLANLLTDSIIIQRLGDLFQGRRSTPERINRSPIKPTYEGAVPGDLSFALPYRYLKDIAEMLKALDKLAPGIAAPYNFVYGVEVKFYSARLELRKNFETKIENLFAAGDGAGITRGLSQASISGLVVAKEILKREGSNYEN